MSLRLAALLGACAVVGGCGGSTGTVTQTVSTSGARAAASSVVLGSKSYVTGGEGWGTARPSKIYNGGDPIAGLLNAYFQRADTGVRLAQVGQSSQPVPRQAPRDV